MKPPHKRPLEHAHSIRSIRAALLLEATDRRHLSPYVAPGSSAFSIIKKETGLKARSARELLPLFDDWIKVELRWWSKWASTPLEGK